MPDCRGGCQYATSLFLGNTHFFPRQFRGPKLKGCKTSFLSLEKRGSCPSHRSGRKACGKVKLDEEW